MDNTDQSGPQAAQPATPPVAAQPTPPPTSGLKHAGSIGEALSNLASYIPGFAGYKAVEDRRIADKQLRAVIGERLARVKGRLDALVDSISRSGNLDGVALIDQSGRKLNRVIDRMRFADYGYAAVFDRVQLGEAEVTRLYEYDAGVMSQLGVFDDAANDVEQCCTDADRLKMALAKLDALTA
ncbi:MAG TPA: hypothetical protein VEJ41_01935, partial [Candidatus Acidoferrales bacterium]|nr:hypothetical protein [Candidatus Acidoferrales bacterium]